MNKKILSVLLAVLMVAGLCFALVQVSATEGGTTYTYYVVEHGANSDSIVPNSNVEANYAKTVKFAVNLAVKKTGVGGEYQPGDKVEIIVYGSCWGETSTNQGTSTNNTTYKKYILTNDGACIKDTEGNNVPVIIRGAKAEDGITKDGVAVEEKEASVWFYGKQNSSTHQDSSRKWATIAYEFKDLRLGVKNEAGKVAPTQNGSSWTYTASAAPFYMHWSAQAAPLSFDHVIFDDNSNGTEANENEAGDITGFTPVPEGCNVLSSFGNHNGWCMDGAILDTAGMLTTSAHANLNWVNGADIYTGLTFKNGDYTNLNLAAAGGQFAVSSNTAYGAYPPLTVGNNKNNVKSYNTTLTIGEGAVMGTIYGVGQTIEANVTVVVKDGATVEALYGTATRTAENQTSLLGKLTLKVEGGQIGTFRGVGYYGAVLDGTVKAKPAQSLNIDGGLKVDISGGTFTSFLATNDDKVSVKGSIEVDISGGRFPNGGYFGGKLTSTTYKPTLTANISGGTFVKDTYLTRRATHSVPYGTLTANITGGTFEAEFNAYPLGSANVETLNVNISGNPVFKKTCYAIETAKVGTVNFTIGKEVKDGEGGVALPAEADQPTFKGAVAVAENGGNITTALNVNIHYGQFEQVVTIGSAGAAATIKKADVTVKGGAFGLGIATKTNASMYGVKNATVNGPVNFTIDSAENGTAAPTFKTRLFVMGNATKVTAGDVTFNVGHELGEEETIPAKIPAVHGLTSDGGVVSGGVYNNVYFGKFTSDANFGNDGAGTDVSDPTHGVGFITTNIYGGTFDASVAAQRGQNTNQGFIRGDLTTNIYGGTFKGQASLGGDDSSQCQNIVANVYGGTFQSALVLVGKTLDVRGEVDVAIYGGTFKNIYATSNNAPDTTNPAPKTITLTLEPREEITINETLAKYGPLAVGLTGGIPTINVQKNTLIDEETGEPLETAELRFGKEASLTVDTIEEGMTLRLYTGSTGSAVVNGKVYVTVLNGEGMDKESLELFTNRDDEFGRFKAVVEDGVYKVVGYGLAPSGAQLVLNDRVGIRVLYSVDEVEEFRAYGFEREFFASFRFGGSTFQSVPYDELKNNIWVDDEGVEYYYVDVITSMGPAAFDQSINTGGFGVIPTYFQLDKDGAGLLYDAKTAWEKAGMTEWVEVAKALIHMGEVANGKTPTQDVTAPELTDATVSSVGKENGVITGYGLRIADAVGIKVRVADVENTQIKISAQGKYPVVLDETNSLVNGDEVVFFVSAEDLDLDYTITATCGDKVTTIVASVETIANVYATQGVEPDVANALLIYANALSEVK